VGTDPSCTVVVRPLLDGAGVSIAGEFDMAAAGYVTASVRPHLGTEVVVDLDAVTFMDSSGLHCLLGLQGEAAALEGRVRVGKVSPVVARLFDLSGVTDTLRRR
jgi:anti-anti-sigma factor